MRWIFFPAVKDRDSVRVSLFITVPNGLDGLLRSKALTLMLEF